MSTRPRRSWKSRRERLAQVSWGERAMLVEATAALLVARARLVFQPFRAIARRFGELVPPSDPRVAAHRAPAGPDAQAYAERVSWAVTRAALHVPFRAVCLPQAIAAHAMLRRRGVASAVHFGAMKGASSGIDAHAWLDAAGVEVTGYPVKEGMAEIGCFV
ncbi:lasso peptide biosynthesis B2 protein [Sphingomonas sp.]|uniref:lasso peptide biosynthesis B2 protein n=1 Tax=Sphingomonas sp. TaxID=28214 RepID=UPI001B253E34|nr:lasso peptide biosynthesis B2 protein [Sphingomonas sp.]MBO9713962.1 lasso peptide biosynthesis B2 protein [Sphingomonas sp.]